MGTVRVLTAERTLAIGAATIVSAGKVGNDLIFYKQNGDEVNVGPVLDGPVGPQGPAGDPGGPPGPAGPAGPPADPVENVSVVASSGAEQTISDVTVSTLSRITLDANCIFIFPAAVSIQEETTCLLQLLEI